MDIHSIDIPGGYSGTVEVSMGTISMEFPRAKMKNAIKLYNLHLLTPERKNIEFYLLRFPDGTWCNEEHLQFSRFFKLDSELALAAKRTIHSLGL